MGQHFQVVSYILYGVSAWTDQVHRGYLLEYVAKMEVLSEYSNVFIVY
jgi:hypothetical protein